MNRYRKLIVALVGALSQALALGLLPAPGDHWAAVVIALATAAGVYATPNQPTTQPV